jgi:hypothetical protein
MKANFSKQAASAAFLFIICSTNAVAQKAIRPRIITMSVDSSYTLNGKRMKKHYTYSHAVLPKAQPKKESPALVVADK